MPDPCNLPGCTLDWNHGGLHSNEERNGKRVRKAIAIEALSEDDSEPAQKPRRASANVLARKAKKRWKAIVPR